MGLCRFLLSGVLVRHGKSHVEYSVCHLHTIFIRLPSLYFYGPIHNVFIISQFFDPAAPFLSDPRPINVQPMWPTHSQTDDVDTWLMWLWLMRILRSNGGRSRSRIWSRILVKYSRLKFGLDFEAGGWLRFWCWISINFWCEEVILVFVWPLVRFVFCWCSQIEMKQRYEW